MTLNVNPLKNAIRHAQRTDRETANLFARYLGSAEHPRGRVLSAYRQARKAMNDAYRSDNRQLEALLVLMALRQSLEAIGREAIEQAIRLGRQSARDQLNAYLEAGVSVNPAMDVPTVDLAFAAWLATIGGQIDYLEALARMDVDPVLMLGDETRVGAMSPGVVNRDGAGWIAAAIMMAWWWWLIGKDRENKLPFQKQPIAAIDNRTTKCCLQVHGQIQPLDKPFILTGTPRFADEMDWTPFHWYCRTSIALYLPEWDDGLTEIMRNEAAKEIERRA